MTIAVYTTIRCRSQAYQKCQIRLKGTNYREIWLVRIVEKKILSSLTQTTFCFFKKSIEKKTCQSTQNEKCFTEGLNFSVVIRPFYGGFCLGLLSQWWHTDELHICDRKTQKWSGIWARWAFLFQAPSWNITDLVYFHMAFSRWICRINKKLFLP